MSAGRVSGPAAIASKQAVPVTHVAAMSAIAATATRQSRPRGRPDLVVVHEANSGIVSVTTAFPSLEPLSQAAEDQAMRAVIHQEKQQDEPDIGRREPQPADG